MQAPSVCVSVACSTLRMREIAMCQSKAAVCAPRIRSVDHATLMQTHRAGINSFTQY